MDSIINDFLEAEIYPDGMYEDIIKFIISFHIRNGEFECNEYIIKKMDQTNFLLFSEYEYRDGSREIHSVTSIYRDNLLKIINEYALTKGIQVINLENLQ